MPRSVKSRSDGFHIGVPISAGNISVFEIRRKGLNQKTPCDENVLNNKELQGG